MPKPASKGRLQEGLDELLIIQTALLEQLESVGRRIARKRLDMGDLSICKVTLKPHAFVTFHSAAEHERKLCIDCDRAVMDQPLLTQPHGRSRMGNGA